MTKERVIEIMNEVLNYSGLDRATFSSTVGENSSQWIADILNPRKKVGISKVKATKICSAYPQINMSYLLTGEGNMLKDESEEDDTEDYDNARSRNTVPLLPASAFAGSIEGFVPDSISLQKCERIMTPVPGAEMAIPITGDSMEPDYPDGSVAYIRRINDSSFIPWGHTVILDTENGAFIKRIYPDEEDADYVWAKSINPEYPPMHIPRESIYRIFRVLATARIYTTM